MGGLAPGADLTCRDKLPDVSLQGGPPEVPPDELAHSGGSRMAGELAGVAPLENPAPDRLGDEKAVTGTPSRVDVAMLGRPDSRLEAPGDDLGRGKDGLRFGV